MNRTDKFRLIHNRSLRQLPQSRSGITLIWLENTSRPVYDENQILLHSFNDRCLIICYTKISNFIKYLKRVRSREYIIAMIVHFPRETVQRIVHQVQIHRVIQTMYVIYSKTDTNHRSSPSIADNLYVFENQEIMFEVLRKRIEEIESLQLDGGLFTTFCRQEKSLKNIQDDLAAFVWTHVFKVLLMSLPCDDAEAKRQMLHECRAYYRNDLLHLKEINHFEQTYRPKDAIHWYTKSTFLYYLVNKALRSQDIWALYRFRYFILDLSCFIEDLYRSQTISSKYVYRGAKLNRDELEQLQSGCIVSTNGFLSCSLDRNVAEMFISTSNQQDSWLQMILFIINIENTNSTHTIVADISQESVMPDENEILFNFGSTFVIERKHFDTNKCIWIIEMSPSADNDQINQGYEKYIRSRLVHINPLIMLGHILANVGGDLGQWMNYFHRLLKVLPVDHSERPNVYYCLGNIYRFIEKYNKALICFRSSRLLLRRVLPERVFDYSRALAGIATIYSYMGKHDKALRIFEEATILQNKSFPDDHTEIPFHYNLMGHAYFRAKQYKRALEILEISERFFTEKMSIELQGYAQTLHIMGLVHRALGNDDKALICFQETIRRRYSLLGKDHPHLASTYYQTSLLYYDRAEYELAFDYIQKSLDIQLIKLPHCHSEPKLSIELLFKIKQNL